MVKISSINNINNKYLDSYSNVVTDFIESFVVSSSSLSPHAIPYEEGGYCRRVSYVNDDSEIWEMNASIDDVASTTIHNDDPYPERPLSAKNLFYCMERDRLLNQQAQQGTAGTSTEQDNDEFQASGGYNANDRHVYTKEEIEEYLRKQQLARSAVDKSNERPTKRRRKQQQQQKAEDEKSHGKILNSEMTIRLHERWKELSEAEKGIFESCYVSEMEQYEKKLRDWVQRNPNNILAKEFRSRSYPAKAPKDSNEGIGRLKGDDLDSDYPEDEMGDGIGISRGSHFGMEDSVTDSFVNADDDSSNVARIVQASTPVLSNTSRRFSGQLPSSRPTSTTSSRSTVSMNLHSIDVSAAAATFGLTNDEFRALLQELSTLPDDQLLERYSMMTESQLRQLLILQHQRKQHQQKIQRLQDQSISSRPQYRGNAIPSLPFSRERDGLLSTNAPLSNRRVGGEQPVDSILEQQRQKVERMQQLIRLKQEVLHHEEQLLREKQVLDQLRGQVRRTTNPSPYVQPSTQDEEGLSNQMIPQSQSANTVARNSPHILNNPDFRFQQQLATLMSQSSSSSDLLRGLAPESYATSNIDSTTTRSSRNTPDYSANLNYGRTKPEEPGFMNVDALSPSPQTSVTSGLRRQSSVYGAETNFARKPVPNESKSPAAGKNTVEKTSKQYRTRTGATDLQDPSPSPVVSLQRKQEEMDALKRFMATNPKKFPTPDFVNGYFFLPHAEQARLGRDAIDTNISNVSTLADDVLNKLHSSVQLPVLRSNRTTVQVSKPESFFMGKAGGGNIQQENNKVGKSTSPPYHGDREIRDFNLSTSDIQLQQLQQLISQGRGKTGHKQFKDPMNLSRTTLRDPSSRNEGFKRKGRGSDLIQEQFLRMQQDQWSQSQTNEQLLASEQQDTLLTNDVNDRVNNQVDMMDQRGDLYPFISFDTLSDRKTTPTEMGQSDQQQQQPMGREAFSGVASTAYYNYNNENDDEDSVP